ncbi:4545_t:CDS:2 [Entrophospora sp. SA101]|nr:4545_t:CDS:2 [Entrophospora sp. SA101]
MENTNNKDGEELKCQCNCGITPCAIVDKKHLEIEKQTNKKNLNNRLSF